MKVIERFDVICSKWCVLPHVQSIEIRLGKICVILKKPLIFIRTYLTQIALFWLYFSNPLCFVSTTSTKHVTCFLVLCFVALLESLTSLTSERTRTKSCSRLQKILFNCEEYERTCIKPNGKPRMLYKIVFSTCCN